MTNVRLVEKDWDFEAGMLPLDFANTAEWHLSSEPDEWLNDYSDLVGWSKAAGFIDERAARSLIEHAATKSRDAEDIFDRAIAMREATFRIFQAVAEGTQTGNSDLALINKIVQESSKNVRVAQLSDRFDWEWDQTALDWLLGPIARSVAELLTSVELNRVGICADEDRGCGYLFYDVSRNHSRKWCSMESCGNRAKAKRHYQRQSNTIIA